MGSLQITVRSDGGQGYAVIAERAVAGALTPTRAESRLSVDEQQLHILAADPRGYGTALGQTLFVGPVREAFADALDEGEDDRLHVLLFVEAPQLQPLRWERLCAPFGADWRPLVASPRTPFSRYLPSLTDRRFPPLARGGLRALVVAASPLGLGGFGLAPFDEAAALAGVRRALGATPHTVLCAQGGEAPPTLDELVSHLAAGNYPLLHLVCHGRALPDGESVIYLSRSGDPAEVDPVTATRLIERLSALQAARGLPQFTFLATCESAIPAAAGSMDGLAHRLVRDLGLPAVVAMSDTISVETANTVAEGLYGRLLAHGAPDLALAEAAAALAERADIAVPALFSRLGGRVLFDDTVDRPLTAEEIAAGLDRLAGHLQRRGPVLLPELRAAATTLRGVADPALLATEARAAYAEALQEVEAICAETTDLTFAALAQGKEPAPYDDRCPFPGLAPFREDDRAFFYGREALVRDLMAWLDQHPCLAVIGDSGTGKSSLIHAGLIPTLKGLQPGLRAVKITPGELPLANLERALFLEERAIAAERSAGDSAVKPAIMVVVDQLEELFTLTAHEEERVAFVDRLAQLPAEHPLVLAMRSDFLGECGRYPALNELLIANLEQIGPMTPEELRAAMEQQAAAVGLRFEAGLTGTILADVRGEPGVMPLLQHALHELWERRRGRWLRADEYRAIGGIQQAIAHTADTIYNGSSPDDKARLREIFVRLTRLDQEGGEGQRRDTRQRVALRDLVPAGTDEDTVHDLVNRLVTGRLVVINAVATGTEDNLVEVAHEALIRHWPRLQGWLSEDRAALLLLAAIGRRAQGWKEREEDAGSLLRGAELDDALALARQSRYALNAEELEYIRRSEAERQREEEARELERQLEVQRARDLAEERQKSILKLSAAQSAQRTLTRFLAVIALLAVLATLGAVVGGYFAAVQQGRAVAARDDALAARNEAVAQQATAVSARNEAVAQQAIAVAAGDLAAQQRADALAARDEARAALRSAARERYVAQAQARLSEGDVAQALGAALVARRLAPSDGEVQRLLALAAEAPAARRKLQGDAPLLTVALSPDGTVAAGGDDRGLVTLWDLGSGQVIRTYGEAGQDRQVWGLAFTPDGAALLTGRADGSLTRYSLGDERRFATGDAGPIYSLALSRDGALLATAHASGELVLWDVALGRELPVRLIGHEGAALSVAISPDGATLLSSGEDGTVRLWSVAARSQLLLLGGDPAAADAESSGHIGLVNSVAFSPDGTFAATASDDSTIGLWDVAALDPEPLTFLSGHTGEALGVAFDVSGNLLVSSGSDGMVMLWDRAEEREVARFLGHGASVHQATFSADGGQVLSASGDASLALWDLRPASELAVFRGHEDSVFDLALSGVGDRALTASADGTVRGWDLASGAALSTLTPHGGRAVWAVALSPDGALAASGDEAGEIALWRVDDGAVLWRAEAHLGDVLRLAFSDDGARLLSVGADDDLALWAVADGGAQGRLALGGGEWVRSASSTADAARVVAGGSDGVARVWDVASGTAVVALRGHRAEVAAVAVSSDGRTIATGALDRTIRLWDAATGRPLRTLAGHLGGVLSLAFSPDGRLLVSGSFDQTVRVWDVATGVELRRLAGHESAVYALVVAGDGRTILSASRDGTMRRWRYRDTAELLAFIEAERHVSPPPPEELRLLEEETGLDLRAEDGR